MRGITDYTLAKRAVIAEFRRGELTRLDICDAHPELLRAARNVGRPLKRPCPICATSPRSPSTLREVRYVFGDQLKDLSGRVVYPDTWVSELAHSYDEFRCYVVEVCVMCSWNHLAECYLVGRSFAG